MKTGIFYVLLVKDRYGFYYYVVKLSKNIL